MGGDVRRAAAAAAALLARGLTQRGGLRCAATSRMAVPACLRAAQTAVSGSGGVPAKATSADVASGDGASRRTSVAPRRKCCHLMRSHADRWVERAVSSVVHTACRSHALPRACVPPLRSAAHMPSRVAEHLPPPSDDDGDGPVSELHLQRLQLTGAQYAEKLGQQRAARAALEAVLADASTLSRPQRHDVEAAFHLAYGRPFLKCPSCWLLPGLCVCSRLHAVSLAPHHVALLVHHKEAGRSSNTGILLTKALSASLHVSGLTEHEDALHARLAASPAACVLWPGEGALTVEQWKEGLPPGAFEAGCTVVAVDATWGCARRMVKRIPAHVPRISLPAEAFAEGKSLLYPVRKYRGACVEKHCTYEATLAALCCLGLVPPEEREPLLLNLKAKVDSLLIYKNRQTAYSDETGIAWPQRKGPRAAAGGGESDGRSSDGEAASS